MAIASSTSANTKADVDRLLEQLPPAAKLAARATKLLGKSTCSPAEIQEIIESDSSLTARTLRVADCPLFRRPKPITTIEQMVTHLGMTRLKRAMSIVCLGELFDGDAPHIQPLLDHALAAAAAGHWLSQRLSIADPEECFVAGLLHDLGKIILYRSDPEGFNSLVEDSSGARLRSYRYERSIAAEHTHNDIGALVAKIWSLDSSTLEAIRDHHQVELDPHAIRTSESSTVIVSLANLVAHASGHGGGPRLRVDPVSSKPARALDIPEDMLKACAASLPILIRHHRPTFA